MRVVLDHKRAGGPADGPVVLFAADVQFAVQLYTLTAHWSSNEVPAAQVEIMTSLFCIVFHKLIRFELVKSCSALKLYYTVQSEEQKIKMKINLVQT